jgi:hypothetical protein
LLHRNSLRLELDSEAFEDDIRREGVVQGDEQVAPRHVLGQFPYQVIEIRPDQTLKFGMQDHPCGLSALLGEQLYFKGTNSAGSFRSAAAWLDQYSDDREPCQYSCSEALGEVSVLVRVVTSAVEVVFTTVAVFNSKQHASVRHELELREFCEVSLHGREFVYITVLLGRHLLFGIFELAPHTNWAAFRCEASISSLVTTD